jgi:hypothetical protein
VKKKIIIGIFTLTFVILSGVGLGIFLNLRNYHSVEPSKPIEVDIPTGEVEKPEKFIKEDNELTQVCENEEFGFQIKVPESWECKVNFYAAHMIAQSQDLSIQFADYAEGGCLGLADCEYSIKDFEVNNANYDMQIATLNGYSSSIFGSFQEQGKYLGIEIYLIEDEKRSFSTEELKLLENILESVKILETNRVLDDRQKAVETVIEPLPENVNIEDIKLSGYFCGPYSVAKIKCAKDIFEKHYWTMDEAGRLSYKRTCEIYQEAGKNDSTCIIIDTATKKQVGKIDVITDGGYEAHEYILGRKSETGRYVLHHTYGDDGNDFLEVYDFDFKIRELRLVNKYSLTILNKTGKEVCTPDKPEYYTDECNVGDVDIKLIEETKELNSKYYEALDKYSDSE